MKSMSRPWASTGTGMAGALCAALLAACGGGSSSPAAPPPAAVVQTLKGVAATGAAVANATVTAKCATGGGTATTAADGSYTVNLTDGSKAPCLLEVATPAGDKLHSLVTSIDAASNTAAANITPLTELVVAEVLGAVPSTVFATADAAALSSTMTTAITATAVSTGQHQGGGRLRGGRQGQRSHEHAHGGRSGQPGSGHAHGGQWQHGGQCLRQGARTLATNLAASGTTLADVAAAQAAGSTTAPPPATPPAPVASPKASLPSDLLQLPAASNCARCAAPPTAW